jgi:quinohemoprotein ethanol dehydrogenase
VQQKAAWSQEHVSPWNGGTLTTAGNLVFQGTADGRFAAYDAKTGEAVGAPTGTGVVAAPVTYEVDGRQYVSIAVGWGGVYGLAQRATERQGPGTVYTFALGGKARCPLRGLPADGLLSGVKYDPAKVGRHRSTSATACSATACRAWTAAATSPTWATSAAMIEHLDQFVFKGPHGARHAGLHRQAQRRGRGEDQGLHPGHGRRHPAQEVAGAVRPPRPTGSRGRSWAGGLAERPGVG